MARAAASDNNGRYAVIELVPAPRAENNGRYAVIEPVSALLIAFCAMDGHQKAPNLNFVVFRATEFRKTTENRPNMKNPL
ncbi:hypothetical protein [Paenibacillus sp. NFR01]|uniref:hypothetical protein n=1 Tax=Paenibacillus sp. NFR01 TaxID=1566279 RepID=UPI000B8887AE|nr:hypothetical protein [Paenibacillus sp. NFR01]